MFKELLFRFLKEKNNIIKEITSIDYIVVEDLSDIENNWEEEDCKKFLLEMSYKSDKKCCPWCSINDSYPECSSCNYGYIHGICASNNEDDTYTLILDGIHSEIHEDSIIKITEIQDLIDRTLKKVKRLCERNRRDR